MTRVGRWLLLAASLMMATKGEGGVGAGNEWKHFTNDAFDFHVAGPNDWACNGCGETSTPLPKSRPALGDETAETWTMMAPGGTTWLKITFIADFPADCQEGCDAKLLPVIEARHPNVIWQPFNRGDGAFMGYSSSAQGDDANQALEYYLVDKRQVIRLEWQKDAADEAGARQLDVVKKTIDRVSRSPEVKDIRTERSEPYQVGDTACYFVEVDDLRAAFTAASLTGLSLKGVPDHFSFKTIEWVGDKNWFKACFPLTTSFGADGLEVLSVDIEGDGDRQVHCYRDDPAQPVLKCPAEGAFRTTGPDVRLLTPHVATVEHPVADSDGPVIHGLDLDREHLTLHIDATDQSAFGLAEIRQGDVTVVAFPDELAAGHATALASLVHSGWNLIEQIIVYDANGLPTMLRIPEPPHAARGKRRAKLKPGRDVEYYEMVPWRGAAYMSTIPVLNFLKAGGH